MPAIAGDARAPPSLTERPTASTASVAGAAHTPISVPDPVPATRRSVACSTTGGSYGAPRESFRTVRSRARRVRRHRRPRHRAGWAGTHLARRRSDPQTVWRSGGGGLVRRGSVRADAVGAVPGGRARCRRRWRLGRIGMAGVAGGRRPAGRHALRRGARRGRRLPRSHRGTASSRVPGSPRRPVGLRRPGRLGGTPDQRPRGHGRPAAAAGARPARGRPARPTGARRPARQRAVRRKPAAGGHRLAGLLPTRPLGHSASPWSTRSPGSARPRNWLVHAATATAGARCSSAR
jgi:hypothetical protein